MTVEKSGVMLRFDYI